MSASGELLLSHKIWGVTWFSGKKSTLHRGLVETPILAKPLQQSFKHEFASLLPMAWRLDLHPGSLPGLKAVCDRRRLGPAVPPA